jgi:hypothetical protein
MIFKWLIKNLKRYSESLIIMKMKIKITKSKKQENQNYNEISPQNQYRSVNSKRQWWENVEKMKSLPTVVKACTDSAILEDGLAAPQMVKELPWDTREIPAEVHSKRIRVGLVEWFKW